MHAKINLVYLMTTAVTEQRYCYQILATVFSVHCVLVHVIHRRFLKRNYQFANNSYQFGTVMCKAECPTFQYLNFPNKIKLRCTLKLSSRYNLLTSRSRVLCFRQTTCLIHVFTSFRIVWDQNWKQYACVCEINRKSHRLKTNQRVENVT